MVASGLSAESVGAIEMGRWVAGRCGADLHVVHVAPAVSESARKAIPGLAERVEEQTRAGFEAFAKAHVGEVKAKFETRIGTVAPEVIDARHDSGADLIVFGRYGKGGYKADRLGSIAIQIARKSPVSVLIVPPDMRGGIKTMACAIDPNEDCGETLIRAASLAKSFDIAEIPVISAFTVPPGFEYYCSWEQAVEKMKHVTEERVREQIAAVASATKGVRFNPEIVEGNPATRIPERANELGVSMLVVGSHQRTGFAFALLGHTAERIITGCKCAVWAERSPKLFQGALEAFQKLLS